MVAGLVLDLGNLSDSSASVTHILAPTPAISGLKRNTVYQFIVVIVEHVTAEELATVP